MTILDGKYDHVSHTCSNVDITILTTKNKTGKDKLIKEKLSRPVPGV